MYSSAFISFSCTFSSFERNVAASKCFFLLTKVRHQFERLASQAMRCSSSRLHVLTRRSLAVYIKQTARRLRKIIVQKHGTSLRLPCTVVCPSTVSLHEPGNVANVAQENRQLKRQWEMFLNNQLFRLDSTIRKSNNLVQVVFESLRREFSDWLHCAFLRHLLAYSSERWSYSG